MDAPVPDLRTLSLREAVEATGIPERTLRSLVQSRRIPYVKVGKYLRFHPADLRAWLAANTKPALEGRSALLEAARAEIRRSNARGDRDHRDYLAARADSGR